MERAPQFEGVWAVTDATLPDSSFAYTGTIEIQRSGPLFLLDWDITAGRYVGIGMLVGDRLLVSCGEQFAGLGLAVYQRQADGGVTTSRLTSEGGTAVGTGWFISPTGDSFIGEHHIEQYLPDGRKYGEWVLSVTETAGVYELTWRKGDAIHWRGLGLLTSNGLGAGWYPDITQLAFLDYAIDPHDANIMRACWALGGYSGLGSETLIRKG